LLDNRFTDGGEVVSLTRQPPFTLMKTPGTHFSYMLSRSQSNSAAGKIRSAEITMTSSGFKPVTFQFVAFCLMQLRYSMPLLVALVSVIYQLIWCSTARRGIIGVRPSLI
jgi:hypothetical protein